MNMSASISMLFHAMILLYMFGAVMAFVFYFRPKAANVIPNISALIAAVLGIMAAGLQLLAGQGNVGIAQFVTPIPYVTFELTMDHLTAFFILTLSILVFAVSLYSIGYLKHYYGERKIGAFNFLFCGFILSMIGVLASGNTVVFLITWELMSLLSFFLVGFEAEEPQNRKAAVIYLIMTHLTTAFIFISFGLIYQYSGSLTINMADVHLPVWVKNVIFVFLIIGFGTKAGLIPLHIWLPYAHPAAPSNVSALMSGIMIKVAIYGIIRFIFGMLGPEFAWWGAVILILGAVSTVLGVAYALMEHNIKRLLAYHSIENIGIILIGVGVSAWACASGHPVIGALALMAALFHLLNHTIFKGALFLGAGAIQYATHTKDLEEMGGLLKKMPYTGLFFLIAALSISALPPLNGFVSEWLTYQALFGGLGTAANGLKVVIILAAAALAMAGALAAACFVKFYGVAFLGRPRSMHVEKAREVPRAMVAGMGLLSMLCVILGIMPGIALKLLDKAVLSICGVGIANRMLGTSSFIYFPLKVAGNSMAPLFVLILGAGLIIAVWLIVKLLGKGTRERIYNTWDCGFTGLNGRMQYSATAFSKPWRIIFRAIYQPTRELEVEEGPSPYFYKSMKYVVATESVFEKYLYLPLTGTFTKFAKRFRQLVQTGSVHQYLIYIFIAIIGMFLYFHFGN